MSERAADRRAWAATVATVAAVYGYFLIFAQFAFLELLDARLGDAALRPAMAAMGAAGVAGSLLAIRTWRLEAYAALLRAGLLACAAAAAAAWVSPSAVTAGAVGLSLGWLTVTLASGLRAAAGLQRLGRAAGLGTGIAYALCNLPPVFQASPGAQTAVAVALTLLATAATGWLRPAGAETSTGPDYRGWNAAGWTLVFLALVWLDSAAFYIIQHTPALKAETWGGDFSLWVNALIHFFAALAAGALMDRGWLGRIAFAAWAALAAACVLLSLAGRSPVDAEIFYTAGVSFYSAALVYYPARGGRPWLAGVLFATAGWLGSALGIGMAQDLHAIPVWFVAATGAAAAAVLLLRQRSRGGLRQPLLALAGLGGVAALLAPPDARADEAAQVARGREVFIAEGCIHCHSQYVRPGTADAERWGPERPLAELISGAPPLPGNRRQGPDLALVGNRRSPEWNRLHLISPREVSPGSRMPSYAHLFKDDRGDALVAYLASLGAETAEARAAQTAAWTPSSAAIADGASGARLFARLCAGCHGPEGRGDGPLASRLGVRPSDWKAGEWRRARPGDAAGLARIVKFGLPGSPMAGHEYLRDDEVVSLAGRVSELHGSGTAK